MLAQRRVVVAEDTSGGPSRRGAKDGHHFYSTLTCALWHRHDFPRPARYTLLQGVRTDTRHDRAGDSAVAGPRSPAPRLLRTCPHPTNVPNISTLWQPLRVIASNFTNGIKSNRLPFQRTQLVHQRVKEMCARLTAGKVVVKGRQEFPQFLYEPFHIAGREVKRGNGKSLTLGPTGW